LDVPLTLACALEVEEKVARRAGARTARVGLGARLPLPEGPLVSFGFAGSLHPRLRPGTLVTATKIVDVAGETLWKGDPLVVDGAQPVVICATAHVADGRLARDAVARSSGADAVDLESGVLATSGRLVGVVRAISDSSDRPLGRLAAAARPDGTTDWRVVARAFVTQPLTSIRVALDARRAAARLERAAEALR
jgi:adenosylhomocysteine nucleosidase